MADQQGHLLTSLDHVNVRTARVGDMADFYCDVLGLSRGPRPPFPFGGAWLYCRDKPVVHLVEALLPSVSLDPEQLHLSHFAFSATGLEGFLSRLRQRGVAHRVGYLPGSRVAQVNLCDPDGNHLHVDFADADDHPAT